MIGTKCNLADKISTITGIHTLYLLYTQGLERSYIDRKQLMERASIAERMSWASSRKTTRVEDIAYSLIGIFDISMPLLYGEGSKAFRRLQEEIMKHSDDQSLLAWGSFHGPEFWWEQGSILASCPLPFHGSGNIIRSPNPEAAKPCFITNRGLQVELPVLQISVALDITITSKAHVLLLEALKKMNRFSPRNVFAKKSDVRESM